MTLEVSEEANYEEAVSLSEPQLSRFLPKAKALEVLSLEDLELLHQTLGRLRLGVMFEAFLEPKSISEEQLLNWEQRDCPWSDVGGDPEQLASEMREILKQIRSLQQKTLETKENQRKQSMDNLRVKKIFENQTRLRENIKSMEHVRTGSLLERYMNDMDKAEDEMLEVHRKSVLATQNRTYSYTIL